MSWVHLAVTWMSVHALEAFRYNLLPIYELNENISRKFQAENRLQISNAQPQPKYRRSYIKRGYLSRYHKAFVNQVYSSGYNYLQIARVSEKRLVNSVKF